jgi:hypothetical protein
LGFESSAERQNLQKRKREQLILTIARKLKKQVVECKVMSLIKFIRPWKAVVAQLPGVFVFSWNYLKFFEFIFVEKQKQNQEEAR